MENIVAVSRVAPSDEELHAKYSRVLPTGKGQCVEEIGKDQVPESVVCRYFGQKSSKSGWKYDCQQIPEEAAAIYDLWQQVYDERLMPNREISLQFARGLILQSQNIPVDWVEFAVGREKYRTRPTSVRKVEGGKKVRNREDVGGLGCGVSVLGKRRCVASSVPPLFKLKIKEEGSEEIIMGKKESIKSGSKAKSLGIVGYTPSWEATELDNMVDGIAGYEKLVAQLKVDLHERCVEKDILEVEARRAKMQLSDRLTLLEQAKSEVKKLCAEETTLRSSEGGQSFAIVGNVVSVTASVIADEAKREELCFNRRFLERTISHSSEIIVECQTSIELIGRRLVESSTRFDVIVDRVSSLESVLLRMSDHHGRMQEGCGNVLFPRPLFSNPEFPISLVHYLNACPVCRFWYSCNNFVSLSCGHTYHQWCLSEHTKKSTSCIFEFCKEPLLRDSATAIGIRPLLAQEASIASAVRSKVPTVEGNKAPSEDFLAVQEVESCWGSERSEKDAQPLSQSNETDVVSHICSTMPKTTQGVGSTCLVCKTNEATIILKGCGHDVFCFGCIQGLRECPLCKEDVAGWELIKSNSGVSPMLLSLGNKHDLAQDPLILKTSVKKKSNAKGRSSMSVQAMQKVAAVSVLLKKKPGRPPSVASKSKARNVQMDLRKEVSTSSSRNNQLFRGTARSTTARNTVPAKFRGLE